MGEFRKIHDIISLLKKDIAGSITSEEIKILEDWKKDKRILDLIDKFDDEEYFERKLNELSRFDSIKAYNKFRAKVKSDSRKIFLRQTIKYVAIFVLPIFLGIYLILNFYPYNRKVITEVINKREIKPGRSFAELKLGDGRIVKIGEKKKAVTEEGGTTIVADSAGIVYPKVKEKTFELRYNELTVPRKGEYFMTLSDGTKIWMNSESSLKYPVIFNGTTREVYLSGEAYFDVIKNKEKPFIVHMGNSKIEVLGTKFNARAYKDELEVYTTLLEGKVKFSEDENVSNSVILSPGYQSVFTKGNRNMEKRKVDTRLYTGWKDGVFSFKNERLETIIKSLVRWYDFDVVYEDEDLKDKRYTGDLARYESVNPFLEMIEISGNVRFEIRKNIVIVRRKK